MTPVATATRLTKKTRGPAVPAKWRKLFALIPGYDPLAQAADCSFDADAAEHVCEFFATQLKHAKGEKAGQPFVLEPWEQGVLGCAFGWKRPDGTRRYREVFLYIAKKQGKSALVSGLILYVLTQDGELGAELYSAACSRDQAAIIFSHCVGMVRQHPKMRTLLKIYGGHGGSVQKSIEYSDEGSYYRCLSADANTADGSNVHFAAIDELHRHKTPELAEILQKSTAARRQPMVVYTTTADYNRPSLCNTKLKYARSVRENKGDPAQAGYDPSFLPVIFEAPADADWKSPAVWRLANPNLGVTVPESFLRRECQKAQEMPSELNNFLRLHLNIVTDADVAWLDMDDWDACGEGTLQMSGLMKGQTAYIGLDLSSKLDITSAVCLIPDGEIYHVIPWFWMPLDRARQKEDSDRVPYLTWIREGHVLATAGNVVDYDAVRIAIRDKIGSQFKVAEVAFDPWAATQIVTQLAGDGFEMIEFRQGFASMSGPAKEFERLVVSRRLRHYGNPVLRWMAGNTMVEQDAAGNIKPSKAHSSGRIDGIVAAIMALGRIIGQEAEAPASVYEKRGLITV